MPQPMPKPILIKRGNLFGLSNKFVLIVRELVSRWIKVFHGKIVFKIENKFSKMCRRFPLLLGGVRGGLE